LIALLDDLLRTHLPNRVVCVPTLAHAPKNIIAPEQDAGTESKTDAVTRHI